MSFDEAVILVITIGLVGAMAAGGIAGVFNRKRARTTNYLGAILLWVIGYGFVTVVVAGANTLSKPLTPLNEPLTYTYVAAEMGFVSGQAYPLQLGGRTGGSAGETNVSTTLSSGLFSARSTSSMQGSTTPASAVSFGYTYEGKTYILEMPTSRITFVQSDTQEPSVTVWLRDETTFAFGEIVYDEYPVSECTWRFNNFIWMCLWPDYNEPGPTPSISQHAMDVGLAPVVMEGFDRATVTLSPEMYRQLLGVIE